MKKSLLILSIAVAVSGLELNAFSGKAAIGNNSRSHHSSSLDNFEKSRATVGRKSLSNSLTYSTFFINGNSPSTRKNSHWLINNEEDIAPLAPDELDAMAELSSRNSTIERIRRIERRKGIEKEVVTSKVWYETMRDDAYVEVFVSGGGFRGGVNPKVHDQIMISNSGFVQKYYESEVTGIIEHKKTVDRDELLAFVKWIAESGFFEFDREYSCEDSDQYCLERTGMKPQPIPLKVVVAFGPYRNVVTVPIFSPEKANDYIDYPEDLRKIVKAIYDFASL